MSDRPRETRWAERLLVDFAIPLVGGGTVHVGAPLGNRGLARLEAAVAAGLDGTEAGQRLSQLRAAIMREHLLRCEVPTLLSDPGAVRLLAAVHDLLFLLHPQIQGPLFPGRAARLSAHVRRLCAEAALPAEVSGAEDLERLLARHTLLAGLWGLSRDDTRVTFWAGRREFYGMQPPRRLLLWGRLRRVRQERWRVICHLQLLGQEAGRAAFLALLSASPLSDLLAPKRLDPPLDLVAHAALLRCRELRRAIRSEYLRLGLVEVGGALGLSLLRLLGRAAAPPALPAEDVHTVLGFVCELVLCVLLGPLPPPPLGSDGALRDLLGLVCALCLHWPAVALPADVRADRALSAEVCLQVEAMARLVGPDRLDELIGLCSRALRMEPAAVPLP
ncbi:MAG: hypothetical protein RMK29_13865 [Myxococcales bacterium]|nr:hypothetical protein [Myxococcota bacterium]MDW8282796.1 hypothetical protein [Myxococcales bacterium]